MAERLKKVLPSIIHPDQKGFVSGRNISEANRMIQDIIYYSDNQNINSSIIFLDYQKAFDRVEWSWTDKCLEAFNFGTKFRNWIQMIFKNAKTCILTNDFQSKYFKISRSMRQGSPVSPLLYIIQSEPLACAIRSNNRIIGFPLPYKRPGNDQTAEARIVAYVDDTQVFNSTEESVVECFNVIKKFEKSSGAKIHKKKTTGLYIGPWKNKNPEFMEIAWTKSHIKTLGILHGYNIHENAIWMVKINKIKTCIQIWKKRDLTIKGRVLVIKSLLLSQIGFEIEIRIIPGYVLKTIETLIWNFLWNDKKPVGNRNAMYLQPIDGGQNMVNIKEFIICKRIKFAYKLIHSNYENWNIIGRYWTKSFDQRYGTDFFLFHCSSLKNLNLGICQNFMSA